MPFVSLLVVFFGVVAIIEEQHIFAPIIDIVLGLPTDSQPAVTTANIFYSTLPRFREASAAASVRTDGAIYVGTGIVRSQRIFIHGI